MKGVLDAIDGLQTSVGLFCDLSKALDCVNYALLLEKINHYGISGTALMQIVLFD